MTRPASARLPALAAVGALCAALGCGLGGSTDVAADFQVGGPLLSHGTSFTSASITQPLAASAGDLSKLSKVTLTAARLESTDGQDLAFVQGASLALVTRDQPARTLATLGAPGAVGTVALSVDSTFDLKPALVAGSALAFELTFAAKPVTARGLRLVLTLRGDL